MRIKAFLSESGSGLAISGSDPGIVESESDSGIAEFGYTAPKKLSFFLLFYSLNGLT
jgi:hypothetical protein